MSRLSVQIERYHRELQARLATEEPDLLAALAKGAAVVFVVFTFLAGLVGYVWPMLRAVVLWACVVVETAYRGVAAWLWQDATTGYQLVSITNVALLFGLLYVLRHWVVLAFTGAYVGGDTVVRRLVKDLGGKNAEKILAARDVDGTTHRNGESVGAPTGPTVVGSVPNTGGGVGAGEVRRA